MAFDIWVIHPVNTKSFQLSSENDLYFWEIFNDNILDSWRQAGPELPSAHKAQAYLIVIDPTDPNSLEQISSTYQQLIELRKQLKRPLLPISVIITKGNLVDAAYAAYKEQLEENIQKLTVLCAHSGLLCFRARGLWRENIKAVVHELFAVAAQAAPSEISTTITPIPPELEALYPELAEKTLFDNVEFSFIQYPPRADMAFVQPATAEAPTARAQTVNAQVTALPASVPRLPHPLFSPALEAPVTVADQAPAVTEEEFDEPIPSEFLCGITFGLMTDPVITVSGQSYNKDALTRWVQQEHSHPVTKAPLQVSQFIPNLALRDTIAAWRTKHLIPEKLISLMP
jgi:hypothetical protein